MTKGNDLFVRVHEDKISFDYQKDGKLKITLGGEGSISWFNEKGDSGDSTIAYLENLHSKHSEWKNDLPATFFGFSFKDEQGKQQAVKTVIEDIQFKSDKGKIILTTAIAGKIKKDDPKEIDDYDRMGTQFVKKHNRWELPFGSYTYKDVDAYIDTFSPSELQEYIGDGKLGGSYDLNKSDIKAKYRLIDPNKGNVQEPYSARELKKFKGINFKDTSMPGLKGTIFSYGINITPSVGATFNAPDEWWNILDYNKYSVSTTFGVNWEASTTLKTSSEKGKRTLAKNTFGGPSNTLASTGLLSATLESGLDLKGYVILQGVKDIYTFSASQDMDFTANMLTSGINYTANAPAIKTVVPKVDPLTGFGLGTTATPWLQLKVGMIVPSGVPVFEDKSLATLNGKISVPVNFEYKNKDGLSATVDVKVNLSGSASVFEFAPCKVVRLSGSKCSGSGWNFPIGDGAGYDVTKWESDNLLSALP